MFDDVRLAREGLAELLRKSGAVEVVGAGAVDAPALAAVGGAAPDVVIVDAALAETEAVVHAIAAAAAGAPLVAVGLAGAMRRAPAGVSGYVGADATAEDLVVAVEASVKAFTNAGPSLTTREIEVAELIAEGLQNKQIASALGIEIRTVKNHVHNIFRKLDVGSRAAVGRVLREMHAGTGRDDVVPEPAELPIAPSRPRGNSQSFPRAMVARRSSHPSAEEGIDEAIHRHGSGWPRAGRDRRRR